MEAGDDAEVEVEDEEIPQHHTLIYEAEREDGSKMGLVISKTIYTLIFAIAETDKVVKIKDQDKLNDYREQTIEMCAEQVHRKAK